MYIVFFFGLLQLFGVFGDDYTKLWVFATKSGNKFQFRCVTNGSGALSWNRDITKGHYTIASQYLSKRLNKNETENRTLKYVDESKKLLDWNTSKSLQSDDFTQPIYDKGWEDFYLLERGSKPFKETITSQKFAIPMSLRTKCKAYLQLEFKYNISKEEKTYYIHFNDNDRICDNENLGTCYNILDAFDEFSFKHYTIFGDLAKGIISFKHQDGSVIFNSSFITHDETVYLSIATDENGNIWKIHNYHYYSTNQNNNFKTQVSIMSNERGYICIALLLAACPECSFEVRVIGNHTRVLKNVRDPYNLTWQERKFDLDGLKANAFYILALKTCTLSDQMIKDQFWAIRNIRTCHKREYRSLEIYHDSMENIACQLIESQSRSIEPKMYQNFTNDTLSGIPCDLIDCKSSVIFCDEIKGCFSTPDLVVDDLVTPEVPIPQTTIIITVTLITVIIIILSIAIYIIIRKKISFRNNDFSLALCDAIKIDKSSVSSDSIDINDFGLHLENGLNNEVLEASFSNRDLKPDVQFDAKIIKSNHMFIEDCNKRRRFCVFSKIDQFTATSFWSTLWDENIQYMIWLITNKSETTSWLKNKSFESGNLAVKMISIDKYKKNCLEILYEVNKGIEMRKIKILSYNVPNTHESLVDSMVRISKKLLLLPKCPISINTSKSENLYLVGSLIFVDFCLRVAARKSSFNLYKTLHLMQGQNPNLIPTIDTYKMCHFLIFDCLRSISSEVISYDDLIKLTADNDFIELQIKAHMNGYCAVIEENDLYSQEENCRLIHDFPRLNPTYVDSCETRRKFIAIRMPDLCDVGDFWRLVVESKVSEIIVLNYDTNSKLEDFIIHPQNSTSLLTPIGEIKIKHLCTKAFGDCYVVDTHLSLACRRYNKIVQMKILSSWPDGILPNNVSSFLQFFSSILQDGNRIIMCKDGITACGLYTALVHIIEELQKNNVLDVPTAIEVVRKARPEFLSSEVQLRFLYAFAEEFCNKIGLNFSDIYSEI